LMRVDLQVSCWNLPSPTDPTSELEHELAKCDTIVSIARLDPRTNRWIQVDVTDWKRSPSALSLICFSLSTYHFCSLFFDPSAQRFFSFA